MIKYKIKHKIVNCEIIESVTSHDLYPPLPLSQSVTLSQTPSPLWSVTYFMDGPKELNWECDKKLRNYYWIIELKLQGWNQSLSRTMTIGKNLTENYRLQNCQSHTLFIRFLSISRLILPHPKQRDKKLCSANDTPKTSCDQFAYHSKLSSTVSNICFEAPFLQKR